MIETMLDMDHTKRLSADQYLDKFRSVVFPETFYKFLWPYAKQFVDLPRLPYDDRVDKLVGKVFLRTKFLLTLAAFIDCTTTSKEFYKI